MTTERRRHPARASRVLAAGLASASVLGLTATFALAAGPEEPAVTDGGEDVPQIVVVRRFVEASEAGPVAPVASAPAIADAPPARSRTRGS